MPEDIISCLPEPLIHHIFSFLDMKQVVQTSLLSRRWRYVWVSNPFLNIDCYMWIDDHDDFKCNEFKDFVNQVLLLRDDSSIHKFYLNCGCYFDSDEFDTWISNVIKRNVQEVKLEGMNILESTLKSLASQVKTLTLDSVSLLDVDAMEELLLSTPVLEHLTIDDFDYTNHNRFTIDAPRLKYFVVNDPDGKGNPCRIEIRAPNLTVLGIFGYMFKDYSLENLSALRTADIDLITCYEDRGRIEGCMKNILRGLVCSKWLTLSAVVFQVNSEESNMLEMVNVTFHSLRHLRLTNWCSTGYICKIAKLLESFPYLETLALEMIEQIVLDPKTRGGDWRTQLSSRCALCHLKCIKIQDTEGSENEFLFLEFLLRNATCLEFMIIIPTKTRLREKEKLVEFCRKLQLVPKASPCVKLVLKEWNFISYLN